MMTAVLTLAMAAGIRIWTEPSLVQTDGGARSAYAANTARVYAARGESESFQLCYRAGRKGTTNLRVEALPASDQISAPAVRLVGFLEAQPPSPRAGSYAHIRPDPLLDPAPVTLSNGDTVVYWVTYHIPRDAKPGIYEGRLRLISDDRRKRTVSVRLEVFNFALPETPSLPGVFRMDRNALRLYYHLDAVKIADWTPIYDFVTVHRMAPLLGLRWSPGEDMTHLKEHIAYLVDGRHAACAALDAARDVLPKPSSGMSSDPLQEMMQELGAWLDEKNRRNRVCLAVESPPNRDQWPELRDQCVRLARLDNRLPILLSGPPHLFFERYVDRWATPFPAFSPELFGRFRAGLSLSGPAPRLPASVSASASGRMLHGQGALSAPEDACDASIFTVWTSDKAPTSRNPAWFQLDFPNRIEVAAVNILWEPGMESDAIEVLISREGTFFSPTTVTWDYLAPVEPYATSVALGRFRYPAEVRGLRLLFRNSPGGGPIGIAEIDLEMETEPGVSDPIASIAPWLLITRDAFPSLAADALPIEARLIPWVCWAHNYEGFYAPAMNQWPRAWQELYVQRPVLWRGAEDGSGCLIYPGPDAPVPSIRLERLRDGMEDYEYLVAVQNAIAAGHIKDPELEEWTTKKFFPPWPAPEDLAQFAEKLQTMRIRAGRALGALK